MGTIIPGSAKSAGSPQYLRDNETRKWAGVARRHQGSLYNTQDRKYVPLSIHLTKQQFYLNSQGHSVSVASYYEQFNNTIDMLENCRASLGEDDGIITKVLEHHDIAPSTATATQKKNA